MLQAIVDIQEKRSIYTYYIALNFVFFLRNINPPPTIHSTGPSSSPINELWICWTQERELLVPTTLIAETSTTGTCLVDQCDSGRMWRLRWMENRLVYCYNDKKCSNLKRQSLWSCLHVTWRVSPSGYLVNRVSVLQRTTPCVIKIKNKNLVVLVFLKIDLEAFRKVSASRNNL